MIEDYYFKIDYSFSSFMNNDLMGEEPTDFINEFSLSIYQVNEEKGMNNLIGKGTVSLLLLNRAIDLGYPILDIFDATGSIMEMAEVVFSLEQEDDYWSKLDEFFEYEMPTSYDTCFIERLELLPEFRGKGLGKWVVKNILERFYGSCGLVVVKAYPLQHESDPDISEDWKIKMKYENMETDLEQAQYKLFHYYQQLGFSNPFDQEYFIIRPEQFDFDQFWGEEES